MAPDSFYFRTQNARKIIVVDFGFLGDSIHLIPALWEIKRHYPKAELHTLSASVGAEVLKLAPCVDRVWAFPLTPKSPRWWKHWPIFKELRKERFDVAFNFSGSDRSIIVTWLTGAKWRLACEAGRKHFWNRWLIPEWVPRQSRELLVYEQRRQVLAACGFKLEIPRFGLKVPEESLIWSGQNIPEKSIHFSINASSPAKEWPLENWIGLAEIIIRVNPLANIVATASNKPRELERVRALVAAVGSPRLTSFEGLSLGRLTALLKRCRLHVGADSGVLHLAMASEIPTFSLFRQYDGLKEWMPVGAQHECCMVPCECVAGRQLGCEEKGESACLKKISPETVFEKMKRNLLA